MMIKSRKSNIYKLAGAAALSSTLLLGCISGVGEGAATEASNTNPASAAFDWLRYDGNDPVFEADIDTQAQYRNPVLAGFYPDPSLTQVGGAYYLVNSTFTYFPGIPVFHSTDLVNWTQIGNVIDRPGMLDFDDLTLSRGVFAPTIEHHDGTFYVANTCVDCGGNFIVTADDPAGPWSDPIWLPEVGGIDPSLYFDQDGTVYVMNNDAPEGEPRYEGHRAIWIRAVDPETFQSISEPVVLIDGGVRPEENPIWIEGPHIYFKDGYYYLSAAEGGTAVDHSQVILRSRTVTGPYEPYPGNPIMTHRHLDPDRDNPITSIGHADYVTDDEGNWWATFLGVRPYEGDYYNTGRETFLMPVRWEDGWPVILEGDERVGYVEERPALPVSAPSDIPMSGNFTITDEFQDAQLPFYWITPRVPKTDWYRTDSGQLIIQGQGTGLGEGAQPQMLGRRQQHLNASATTKIDQLPADEMTEAGLTAFQSDDYFYSLGGSQISPDTKRLTLRMKAGSGDPENGVEFEQVEVASDSAEPIYVRITAKGDTYEAAYSLNGEAWETLRDELDGKNLSTRRATGFVGAVFGLYVQSPE